MQAQRALMAAGLAAMSGLVAPAVSARSIDEAIAELRRGFTVDGRAVSPLIFREFGDGNLADPGSIWVTVDLRRAARSNMYAAEPTRRGAGAWVAATSGAEEYAYRFVGTASNGLIVVTTSAGGGGSGNFYGLYVLEAKAGRGFDGAGKIYDRLDLTAIRKVSLGDRWTGDVSVSGDTVTVTTKQRVPPDAKVGRTMKIKATRP